MSWTRIPAPQPVAARAAAARTRQAAVARPLGNHAGAQLRLHPSEPGDQGPGSRHDLRHRSGSRRTGPVRERLAGRHLQRALPVSVPGRGRDAAAVPPVLVPGWGAQPCRARRARIDPRGRRAGVLPRPRLRRRVRQPGPGRGLRGGRRGSRDRAAGRELALQQVPQSRPGRRGAPDPAPERLQDCQSGGAGADTQGGSAQPARRIRSPAVFRRGRRSGPDAPADGDGPGHRAGGHRTHPARGAPARLHRVAALADDRATVSEGLDRP